MEEPAPQSMLLQCNQLLGVLLHHPSMNTLPVVSRLLATSRATAAAIATHCLAAVPVRLQGASPAEHNPFVARHGRLFCSLFCPFRDSASLAGVAAAMAKAAAAAPDGALQLRSLAGCCLSGAMLACVSPRHLTSLALDRFPPGDAGLGAALGRLTALQRLRISDAAPQLLPALAALTQLTQLTLGGLDGPALVQLQRQLPASLRSLTLQARPAAATASEADGGQPTPGALWQLGHLTSLTHLSPVAELQPCDELPPNLPACQVVRCRCVRPLLPLQRLVQLRIRSCEAPSQELRLLAGLPRLADVFLEFANRANWQAAAAALALLPVRELRLSGSCAAVLQDRQQPGPAASPQPGDSSSSSSSSSSEVFVQQLATLQGLQDLWISNKVVAATQQIAGLLRQLTGLRNLSLINICSPKDCWQQAAIADGMLGLFCAAAALPLQSLRLSFMRCCSPETVAELAGAARLTELCLHDCDGVDDASVEALVARLTMLQVLDVSRVYASRGSGVTDAVLPVLAAALPRLRELRLNYCTHISDVGVACLSGLQLKDLDVDHTPVSPAARLRVLRRQPVGVQHSAG